MDDKPLIETLPQHEWDALIGSIINRYRHLCGDDALIDRDDLQQEAWVALLNAAHDYDPENKHGAKLSTFAHQRIRYHLCGYITKRLENKPTQVAEDPFDYTEGKVYTDETIEESDLMKTIFGAVEDEPYAYLLREHFIEDLSYRKLARRHGCSHETIGTRINKLLGLLEKRLNRDNE